MHFNFSRGLIMVMTLIASACQDQPGHNTGQVKNLESIDKIPAGAKITINDLNPELKRVSLFHGNRLEEDGEYLKGLRSGTWTTYHPNGMVKEMTSYINGVKQGVHIKMEKNGELRTRVYYVNGLEEGPYFRFKNRKVVQTGIYKNGLIHGEVKRYYPTNGKLMEERYYVNDTLQGTSRFYDEGGNVKLEMEFKDGELIKNSPKAETEE